MNPYTKRGRFQRASTMRTTMRYRQTPEETKTSLFLYRGLLKDTPTKTMFVITTIWVAMMMGFWTIHDWAPGFNDVIDSINGLDTNIDKEVMDYM